MAENLARTAESYRVSPGRKFRLAGSDPADTGRLDISKKQANALLAAGVVKLADLQTRLYAQDCWPLLVVLQAMDAAGKDSTIKHVMSGINPQGCQVVAFKVRSLRLDLGLTPDLGASWPQRRRVPVRSPRHQAQAWTSSVRHCESSARPSTRLPSRRALDLPRLR